MSFDRNLLLDVFLVNPIRHAVKRGVDGCRLLVVEQLGRGGADSKPYVVRPREFVPSPVSSMQWQSVG